jgi:hypothetical protein
VTPVFCEVADILQNEEPCRRLAQWWWVGGDVKLCHFHAEPLLPECNPGADAFLVRLEPSL